MVKRFAAITAAFLVLSVPASALELSAVPSSIRQLTADEKITADELQKELKAKKNIVVLDARNKKNYDEAHIAGAELPLEPEFYTQMDLYKHGILPQEPDHMVSLKKKLSKFSKDQPIVTYCSSNCKASTYALFDIKKLGYTNVRAMEEGIEVWQAKGYPVEVAAGE